MWYKKKRIYAILLLIVLLVLFLDQGWLGRHLYPLRYEADIRANAERHEMDPYLLAAIIRVESNFQPNKTSPKGAYGLMQLMPATAEWIVKQGGYPDTDLDRLDNPSVNISIGSWYVHSLYVQFVPLDASKQDEIALIAAAYNAGPGNVRRWLQENTWEGSFDTMSAIPFGETRHYIQRILYYYEKYEQYYPELSSPANVVLYNVKEALDG